ncbi:hypothetical protein F2Q69_00020303 [Brassica cretica]|uniref:Anaphase-promoting complex subunit 4 WD40 domain-containing protein n=1 Tax=Brassica cretica TaxID=69181 RepID=A0A8S9Q4L1_BRACR|nr:hypothetical protein F2Q69_00020303 [Brassica cretica]
MAISGNLRISASLVSPYHRHPKCLSLPSSKFYSEVSSLESITLVTLLYYLVVLSLCGSGEVISTGLDKQIKFWDTRLGQSLVLSTDAGAPVRCITVNGNSLVVCVAASMHIYDLRSLDRPFQSYESQVEVPIRCVTSVPFSTGYAVGSVDGQVALDFPNTACSTEMKYTFRCHPKSMKGRLHGACINAIEFTPGGSGTFVTGDNEGYVISWNAKSRRRLFELPKYSNSVASLAFNHTGELLAVASSHTYQEASEKEEPPQVFIHKF